MSDANGSDASVVNDAADYMRALNEAAQDMEEILRFPNQPI